MDYKIKMKKGSIVEVFAKHAQLATMEFLTKMKRTQIAEESVLPAVSSKIHIFWYPNLGIIRQNYLHSIITILVLITAIDCVWGTWGSWAQCSKTCEDGITTREREKLVVEAHSGVCQGPAFQLLSCTEILTENWVEICPGKKSTKNNTDKSQFFLTNVVLTMLRFIAFHWYILGMTSTSGSTDSPSTSVAGSSSSTDSSTGSSSSAESSTGYSSSTDSSTGNSTDSSTSSFSSSASTSSGSGNFWLSYSTLIDFCFHHWTYM